MKTRKIILDVYNTNGDLIETYEADTNQMVLFQEDEIIKATITVIGGLKHEKKTQNYKTQEQETFQKINQKA